MRPGPGGSKIVQNRVTSFMDAPPGSLIFKVSLSVSAVIKMEHWQKVTIGTIGGVVATFVFYFFVGKLLDYCYIKKKKRPHSEVHPRPERFYAKTKNNVMVRLPEQELVLGAVHE